MASSTRRPTTTGGSTSTRCARSTPPAVTTGSTGRASWWRGGSQGGGLALAVAGLRDDLSGVLADVPYLSHFRRAISVAERGPYLEIARYLKADRRRTDDVLRTLDYFDVAALVTAATAPALFSVALQDDDLPAVHGLRGLQRLRRATADRRVPVQRP